MVVTLDHIYLGGIQDDMLDLRRILESQVLVETMLGVFYFLKMISTQMDIENINLYTGLNSHILYILVIFGIQNGVLDTDVYYLDSMI